MDDTCISPPTDTTSSVDALQYYKQQYESLEAELKEFQSSSQELEAELEKDVEAAEKRERVLKEKAESLEFEVEEWKTKYKQSKTEAGTSQANLQKEITTLRDTNRSLQMKLRDIEVQNDDFERQARNTSGSIEDLETRLNASIERGVMMEEEIRIGEQERENLRIETQRLRDELSDLKIEAEIMQDKLKRSAARLPALSTDITAPHSPTIDNSPLSTASSPMINTPPDTKSMSTIDDISETPTPPSPPISESSAKAGALASMQPPPRPRTSSIIVDPSSTFARSRYPSNATRPLPRSRPSNNLAATAHRAPESTRNPGASVPHHRTLPNSTSLSHIRSLTAQMQALEMRVQSARSKLPAPSNSPRSSPSGLSHKPRMPSSVTIRNRKRTGTAATSSTASHTEDSASERDHLETPPMHRHVSRVSTSGISRLSFGPLPAREKDQSSDTTNSSRPRSRISGTFSRPERPMSRTDSYDRPASRADGCRPESRAGRTTPLGHYTQSSMSEQRRPPSSTGYFNQGHKTSASVSHVNLDEIDEAPVHNPRRSQGPQLSTPNRTRKVSSVQRDDNVDGAGSGIPTPSALRRKSGPGFPHIAFGSSVGDRNSIGGRRVASGMPLGTRADLAGEIPVGGMARQSPQRQSVNRLSQPRSPIVRQRTEPLTRRKLSGVGESY